MSRVIVLLRAVNVGGRNKLPMAELRAALEDVGFENVSSYIQSGNLVIDPGGLDEARVEHDVAAVIADRFGLAVAVIARTPEELERVIARHPFAAPGLPPEMLHVCFLERAPAAERVASLDVERFLPDRCRVDGREVYLHYPNGSGRSKLTGAYLERQLGGIPATARNLTTIRKLVELTVG